MKLTGTFFLTLNILFVFFGCKKEYSYERGPEDILASGYLQKISGDCAPPTINGVYKTGIELGNNNSVVVQVYFNSPGKYKIVTDSQNGFSFADSAVVTDTGYQRIKLKATGKPIKSKTTDFFLRFDTSVCTFSVPVLPDTVTSMPVTTSPNSPDSKWQFSVDNKTYQGFFDGASTHVLNGSTIITLVGLTPTKDSAIAIIINIKGTTILTGTYKTPKEATFLFFGANGKDIFSADKIFPGVELSFIITKYDASTRVIEGSFSGTVLNNSGTAASLTTGMFKAQLKN